MAYPLTELWFSRETSDAGEVRGALWLARGRDGAREEPAAGRMWATPADRALINRLRLGDSTAFSELFDTYAPKLWRFAARQLGSMEAAQDAVQDVLVALWERRERLDPETNVTAYLYGAVRRRGLHLLRHERLYAAAADRGGTVPTAWRALAPDAPDDAAQAAELEAALAAALAPLSELQRSALALRRAGLTHAEIGASLSITTEAARKHVTRALVALQTVLARFASNER